MKLIKPSAEIINISGDLKTIELSARTCYKSEDKISDGSAERLVGNLVNRGHFAMLEFVDVTVRFITDRGIANEIVRHRIASYAQESTRYVSYKNREMEFIEPEWVLSLPDGQRAIFVGHLQEAETLYCQYIEEKIGKPQDARAILPLCLKTELVMKTNLRSWYNFFELRTAPAAHPEMRRIAIPLLEKFKKEIPIIFDDITH
jgi:thymidylate synthase (FAD)